MPSAGAEELRGVLSASGPLHAVLQVVASMGGDLETEAVLRRIVEVAVELAGARYGALGVIGQGGHVTAFLPVGLDVAQLARIGNWPQGHGLLGDLISDPRPLRSHDLSAHPRAAGFPAAHPPMRSFLGVPILIRGESFGGLYLTDKHGGGPFDDGDERLLVALAAAAGATVERDRLRSASRQQKKWQQAAAAVNQRLLSQDNPDDVLALAVQQAMEISEADLVLLTVPVGTGDQLVIQNGSGAGAAQAIGISFPRSGSLSGLVMASGQPMSLDDFDTDPRAAAVSLGSLGLLGPAVLVPVGRPGEVLGVLTAGRKPGRRPLSRAAVGMLTTFAAQAGIGLELAAHRRDAEQVALLADRDRIARDLHDQVIQRLFATGMSLQGIMPLLPEPEPASRVRRAVDELDELDETIRDIRSAIYALQARDEPQRPGVRSRIVQVTEGMTAALGCSPGLRIDSRLDSRVCTDIAEDMLAVLREALCNVARHAHAGQVSVTFDVGDDLTLIVTDDGVGIRPGGRRSGLANLRQRAAELGGHLSVAARESGGTRLEWRVPLHDPHH